MSREYDPKRVKDIFGVNASVDIPEERTALGIARSYNKEGEWLTALMVMKIRTGSRVTGTGLQDLLEEVCTQQLTVQEIYSALEKVWYKQ